MTGADSVTRASSSVATAVSVPETVTGSTTSVAGTSTWVSTAVAVADTTDGSTTLE